MLDTKKITIFGCGWLGFPLAQRLIKKGYVVLGTTTQESKLALLEAERIKAYNVNFMTEQALDLLLFYSEILVLAFPPKTKSTSGDWYIKAVKRIVEVACDSDVKKIILLSSTSVYPDLDQTMMEDFPISSFMEANPTLHSAEQIVLSSNKCSVILRLGGLAGDDRWLARHFSGKNDLPNGNSCVNLLHREDALRSIEICLERDIPAGVYNICSPEHPTKEELYTKECLEAGWPLPLYRKEEKKGSKIVLSDKWIKTAEYDFLFPSPLDFTYTK